MLTLDIHSRNANKRVLMEHKPIWLITNTALIPSPTVNLVELHSPWMLYLNKSNVTKEWILWGLVDGVGLNYKDKKTPIFASFLLINYALIK